MRPPRVTTLRMFPEPTLRPARPLGPPAPKRTKFPTVFLSDLVLDLDAEDAKGVRNYDELVDGVPEDNEARKSREFNAVLGRVVEFEESYRSHAASLRAMTRGPSGPMHVSDVDILVAAMSDSHLNHTSARRRIFRSVLVSNGATESILRSPAASVEYMLQRQWQRRNLPPKSYDKAQFDAALSECYDFHTLLRLVSTTMRTKEGCRVLSQMGRKLRTRFEFAITGPLGVAPALATLNDLLMNMDRYGERVSPDLCELGYFLSLRCHAWPTAQRYLERRLDSGDALPRNFIPRNLELLDEKSRGMPTSSLPLYSLLTGYVPGEERNAASFRSLVDRRNPEVFGIYIQCLLNLSAFRTVWHELCGGDTTPWMEKSGGSEDASVQSYREFLANTLERVRNTDVVGDFESDCQFDMVAISDMLVSKASRHRHRRVSRRKAASSLEPLVSKLSKRVKMRNSRVLGRAKKGKHTQGRRKAHASSAPTTLPASATGRKKTDFPVRGRAKAKAKRMGRGRLKSLRDRSPLPSGDPVL